MKQSLHATLILCIVVFFSTTCSLADDSVYSGDGVDVFPLASSDIQMVSEVITITDRKAINRFRVDVDMVFKNHGNKTVVQIGFPILIDQIEGETIKFDPGFRTWVDGTEVKITQKRGIPNPINNLWHFSESVYTYKVAFEKNQIRKIRHSYSVGGTVDSMGGWNFTYILRTGALWKGSIEDFTLIYKTSKSNAAGIIGFIPKEQEALLKGDMLTLIWRFKDFKPSADFEILGGSKQYPVIERSVYEDLDHFNETTYFSNAAELRYTRNKLFASYGYPFKSPFVRAQFYYPGSEFKEDRSYSETDISQEHLAFIERLQLLDERNERKFERQVNRIPLWAAILIFIVITAAVPYALGFALQKTFGTVRKTTIILLLILLSLISPFLIMAMPSVGNLLACLVPDQIINIDGLPIIIYFLSFILFGVFMIRGVARVSK